MPGLSFPIAEYHARLDRLQKKLAAVPVDVLVVTRPENVYYLTGYRAAHIANRTSELHAALVPAAGDPRIIARALEAETVKVQWTPDPLLFKDHEDPYRAVAELVNGFAAAARIGIEKKHLRASQFDRLARIFPEAEFVDVTGLVEGIAGRLSDLEVDCMRRAARITDLGLQAGLREIRPGVYPYDIIGAIHAAMYAGGQSDFDKSLVAVWSGPGGGRMHDTDTTEQVKPGDVVTIEIMGVDKHYRTGVQTCTYVGDTPPAEIIRAHEMVVAMHAAARAAVRPGGTAGEVFDAADAVYRAATGRDYYRRVGGSMGLTQFQVDLVKGRDEVLRPGVALLVQTLVDDPVLLTCASTVLVTEDGCDDLTRVLPALRAGA